MCVCVCVCVSRSEPDALWPNPWSHSFRSWLIWKVNSSSFRRCKKFCRVTWPWPIYLAPKWPPVENRVFFAMFSRFVRKRTEISKWLQWTANIGMWVWAFQRHQNQPPNLTPSPHLGGRKHEKNAKNGCYHFQMIKLCAVKFFRSQTSSGKIVCTYVWKTYAKFSKSVHNYTFYTDVSAPPRLTQMR